VSPSRRRRRPPCPLPCRCSPVTRLPRLPVGTSRLAPRSDAFDRTRGLALPDVAPLFGLHPPPGIRGRSVSGPCPVVRYPLVTFANATFAAVLPQRRSCRPLRLQRCPGSPAGSRVSATTDLLEVSA
jgi:hypothetical protein